MSEQAPHNTPDNAIAVRRREAWQNLAACVQYNPELWFPTGSPGSPWYQEEAEFARAVCRTCPVKDECLTEAIMNRDEYGIWGGYDSKERKAMIRRDARVKAVEAVASEYNQQ